jgi:hypothetical protein
MVGFENNPNVLYIASPSRDLGFPSVWLTYYQNGHVEFEFNRFVLSVLVCFVLAVILWLLGPRIKAFVDNRILDL